MTRLADTCPSCGESHEPAVILQLAASQGVECLYECGCGQAEWWCAWAYPV